jgi:hypothetical protein
MVLGGGLLVGCTIPLLPDLNAGLQSVNASLRGVNDSLRGTSGTPATVAASASDACDPTAFKAGFEDQYVTHWNMEIGSRETHYRFISQQRPENAAARHNYELYRGKPLSGKGIGYQMEYRVQFDNQGRILNYCQSNSYMKGESAGIRAAGQAIQALTDQELEISSL